MTLWCYTNLFIIIIILITLTLNFEITVQHVHIYANSRHIAAFSVTVLLEMQYCIIFLHKW